MLLLPTRVWVEEFVVMKTVPWFQRVFLLNEMLVDIEPRLVDQDVFNGRGLISLRRDI